MMPNTKGSLFWKGAEYIAYVFFALFPFIHYQTFLYGGTSTRAVNFIFFVTLLGIGYACWLFRKNSSLFVPYSPILLALVLYGVAVTVSGVVGLNFSTTFWSAVTRTSGIWYLLHLGLFVFLGTTLFYEKAKRNNLIATIVISSAVYSALSLLGPEGVRFLFKGYRADGFTFGNSTFAGMYLFGSFLLSVYFLYIAKNRRWWMYTLPFLIVINPFILSRDVWFGDFSHGLVGEARASAYVIFLSILAFIGMWLVSKIRAEKQRNRVVVGILAVGIIGMAFLAFSLLSPDGLLRRAYLSQATGARPLVWEISSHVIAQRPSFGWGGDNFERIFEQNYDNRLLQDEYGKEAWFDRAHNVFIDEAVQNGFVGLSAYLLVFFGVILSLIYTVMKSSDTEDRIFASFLLVYFSLHILELQTAFDTTASYPIIAFFIVCAIVLFDRTLRGIRKNQAVNIIVPLPVRRSVAVVLVVFFTWSIFWGLMPFIKAQVANGYIRTVGHPEKRIPIYETLFGSPVDKHAFLWRTSTDFQRGIAQSPDILNNPSKVENLKKEIAILEAEYKEFIKENPSHFRAHLNLADILIYERLFGIDKLAEAQTVLDEGIKLVPQSPQSYWMKSVAYVYMRKFDLARESAKRGLDLNPKIVQSQKVVKYVEDSIKTFPNIDLYFFTQI